jgi:2-dehydro-3-deoxyphosphogluconate aldolase / (4S)-4-hydroxy-2-oxoglutarate aldolase
MVKEADLVTHINKNLISTLSKNRILTAITIEDADDALPLAEAMLKGGLDVMEIAFRTNAAAASIALIRKHLPEMIVGAGTLLHRDQVLKAIDAGAAFGLTPGFNPRLCELAKDHQFAMIPGVITPSEIENAFDMGYRILKLFPISQFGGLELLKALDGPYRQLGLQYIPMGGVGEENFMDYLNNQNVIAVGGSWLTSGKWMETKNFQAIQEGVAQTLIRIQKSNA